MAERYQEVDALRGLAVCGMILFHFLFDYAFLVSPGFVDVTQGGWFWFGRAVAVTFIILSGVSWTLHTHRKHDSPERRSHEWRVYVRRGILLLSGGLVISLLTFVLFHAYAIWFGVLHLLGLSFIIGIPFLHRPRAALGAGTILTAGGLFFSTLGNNIMPFWPIILPVSFSTFDYFPLLPWFGIFLLGIRAGHFFYPRGMRSRFAYALPANVITVFLSRIGKKSLLIYFVHQPVLVGAILFFQQLFP